MHFLLRKTNSDSKEFIISVSKKVAKSAVTRNLIKRRVRPILQALSPKLPVAQYLLIAKAGAQGVKSEALKDELKTLFKLQ